MDADEQRTIVVTGAATGVGAAVVEQLTERGCKVYAVDIAAVTAADAVHPVVCDLADRASIDAALAELPGSIDGLVNVAGVAGPEPRDWVVKVNFLGLRHLSEGVFDRLSNGGAVVSVSSTAGRGWERRREVVEGLLDTDGFDAGVDWLLDNEGKWAKDPYTFSKQCVTAWSLRESARGAKGAMRVNVVSPGGIDTQLTASFRQQMGEAFSDWRKSLIERSAVPAEIAEPVVWLTLGPASWVNGADLIVDRGIESGDRTGWVDMSEAPGR